jgi:hypothetical protein
MKNLSITLFVLLNAAFASSAIAGRDEALIQITRKNQLAHDAQVAAKPSPFQQPAASATHATLSLDHGPHAVVTPWVNDQRRLRAEEEKKAKLAGESTPNQAGGH